MLLPSISEETEDRQLAQGHIGSWQSWNLNQSLLILNGGIFKELKTFEIFFFFDLMRKRDFLYPTFCCLFLDVRENKLSWVSCVDTLSLKRSVFRERRNSVGWGG